MIALSSPLESNDHGDKDGATEDNGVEGVEDLGEEESIELSRVRDRPVEDSSNAVVKKTEDEENIVKAGEDNEQVVEGALHIIGEKDVNRKGVAKKSKDSNRNLNMNLLALPRAKSYRTSIFLPISFWIKFKKNLFHPQNSIDVGKKFTNIFCTHHFIQVTC